MKWIYSIVLYLLFILLMTTCNSTRKIPVSTNDDTERLWFKTYVDEIDYYEYISPLGEVHKFTHEDMIDIGKAKNANVFWNAWVLQSITFKNVE